MRKGFTLFLTLVLLLGAFPPGGASARADLRPPAAATPLNAGAAPDLELDPLSPGPPQVRALWVDAFNPGLKTPEQIDKLVADAWSGGFNTLIAQVRRRGDRYFQQGIEPFTEDPAVAPGFDPLAALIAAAHARGLEVHAWGAVLPVWRWPAPPRSPDHVYNRHGPGARGRDRWLSYTSQGAPTYFLDPGHPDAAAYTAAVFADLVRRYPVDGIHLDYIRYDAPESGYNPVSVERFNARYRRSGQPDPKDPHWSDWRRQQVTSLVRRIYLEALAVRPAIKVSAALIAWGEPPGPIPWTATRPYGQVFQDWRAWLEEGILDLALPMDYFQEFNPRSQEWYNGWIEWQKDNAYGRQVAAGVGAYFNYLEDTIAQMRRALAPSGAGRQLAGVAVYAYATTHLYGNGDYNGPAGQNLPRQPYAYVAGASDWLYRVTTRPAYYWEPALQREVRLQPVFPDRAPVPAMPWKQAPAAGHLTGVALDPRGRPLDGVPVVLTGPDLRRTQETDGGGWYGFAHVPPGDYTLRIGFFPVQEVRTVRVEAGRVTRVPPAVEKAPTP